MSRLTLRAFAAVLVCCVAAPFASAQRAPRSEMDLLKRPDIRERLGLSEGQITQLTELEQNTNVTREVFDRYKDRLAAEQDRDAQAKIREEMNQEVAQAMIEFQNRAVGVLNDNQKGQLRGIYFEQAGPRAFSDQRIAAEYGLSDEQKETIDGIYDTYRDQQRSAESDEDRAKAESAWKESLKSALNEQQFATFSAQAAQVPQAESAGPAAVAGPAGNSAYDANPPAAAMPGQSQAPAAAGEAFGSFGPAADLALEIGERPEKVSFSFSRQPWEEVLVTFAQLAGYTLDMDRVPPGSFTHISEKEYTPEEALDIMNGYLLRRGYAILKKDGFLIVLNVDGGLPPSLVPLVPIDDLADRGQNEIVQVEIPIEGVDVGVLAREAENLLGAYGQMTAFTETGTLLLTDIASNLTRIKAFLDASLARRKPDLLFQMYYLNHVSADEAEMMLLMQFGMRAGVPNVSESGRSRGGSSSSPPDSSAGLQVAADLRMNALMVTGNEAQQQLAAEIIKAIDVNERPDGSSVAGMFDNRPVLRVYNTPGADAREVAKTIDAVMPGIVVNEDGRNAKLHILATPRQHDEVGILIQQMSQGAGSGSVAVIPLVKMDPLSAAAMLRSLFINDGSEAPNIETDLYSRQLIIKGSAAQITQIREVLRGLGEDGSGVRVRGNGDTVRRYGIHGRSANQFLQMLQKGWENNTDNPLIIQFANQAGPVRSIGTVEESLEEIQERNREEAEEEMRRREALRQAAEQPPGSSSPSGADRNTQPDDRSSDRPRPLEQAQEDPVTDSEHRRRSETFLAAMIQADESAPEGQDGSGNSTAEDAQPTTPLPNGNPSAIEQPQSGRAPVVITVVGDELLLSSDDPEALDQMEEMLDLLQENIPYRQTWDVVYLVQADAQEAADMLNNIFPSSSVASTSASTGGSMLGMLGGGFQNLGNSLMQSTGLNSMGASQSLNIIPDVTSNALWISGPDSQIADAKEVLKIIDSSEIPASLREMQPRTIIVRYADVRAVETFLKDAFKVYLEAQGGNNGRGGGNQQGGGNPLMQMLGGGRNDQQIPIRMTLAVFPQTSQITVSSSLAIFKEVESVVLELDEQARRANPRMVMVQLKNADAQLIQQSLSSLLPNVNAASATTRAGSDSSSSSSSGGGSSSPPGGGGGSDPFSQMIQQRMRERFGGGGGTPGGGGSPFGGGNPFGGGRPGGFGGFGGGRRGGGR